MNETKTHGYSPVKRLRRRREGRIIAGVCSGAAEFIGIDVNILRIAFAVATFFGGLGVGIYAVAWLLIPEGDKQTSIAQDLISKQKNDSGSAWHQVSSYWQQQTKAPQAGRPPYADQAPADRPAYADQAPQDAGQPSPAAAAPHQQANRPTSPVDEPPTTS